MHHFYLHLLHSPILRVYTGSSNVHSSHHAKRHKTHASPILAVPDHAEEGHHDGMISLSEWKTFFVWASERGQGEKYLAKAEKAADAKKERFDERVEAVFHLMDTHHSGELSLPQMERIFGEDTHEFWEDMDGETQGV